jgi:hypothetical protein
LAEAYRINSNCVLLPPGTIPPSQIDMPVTTVNGAPSPIFKIVARQGSRSSWERETALPQQRYADIYFNSNQFNTLINNVNTGTRVYVTYDAPAIAGDDRISNQSVTFSYP